MTCVRWSMSVGPANTAPPISNGSTLRCAIERDEDAVRTWRRKILPALKKALRERRLIVFIDESGLSERPTRGRTGTPRGEAPRAKKAAPARVAAAAVRRKRAEDPRGTPAVFPARGKCDTALPITMCKSGSS